MPRYAKTWLDYRIEELEEKANVMPFPERDMDGCRFSPDPADFEETEREDAYVLSVSERLCRALYGF